MNEMVLQDGSLGDFPVLDLILLARGSKAPTILELSRGETTRRFWFRDGTVVAFTTTNPREGLATYLVRRQKLTGPEAKNIETIAEQQGITPAQAILQDRVLPTPELAKELAGWATLLLVQAFSWTTGTFRLLADPPNQAPPETLYELNLASAAAQGVWKRMSDETIRAMVTPYLDMRADVGASPAFKVTDFRLPPPRLRFWEQLREHHSVRATLRATDLPEADALRCVYLLHRTGLVDLVPNVQEEDDLDDFGFDTSTDDLSGWLDDLGDLPGEPAPEVPAEEAPEEEEAPPPPPPAPRFSAGQPSMGSPRQAPPSAPRPQAASGLGVDLSSIGFRRSAGTAKRSSTYHVAAGLREELGTGKHPTVDPEDAETQHEVSPVPAPAAAPMPDSPLSSLFDNIGASAPARPTARRSVAPPRGGGGGGWKPGRRVSAPPAEESAPVAAAPPPPPPSDDGPPPGPGPVIDAAEWARLPTKEKDRIRGLRTMLATFEHQNYFEYFELSHEASPALIKKAYFKMARRFHPDALVDEGEVYRTMAESVFASISEAYEVIGEDESRDKYTRKHIHGEKDENDLAMERVQELLKAEGSYRAGIRLLNQGKLGKAVEEFEAAVAADPEEAEYRGYLGFALFRANQHADYEKALGGEELLMESIAAKPQVAGLPHLMGKIAMQRKDWSSARKWLRKSLKIKADNPEALREYKRVDEMIKGGGKSGDEGKAGLKGLFGRFGKK